jgi:hypothetical protein
MNIKGALTDRHGRLLRVGQRVRLIEEYSCASYYVGTRTGTIESLDNTAGSDHQGEARVAFDEASLRTFRVPDTSLIVVGNKPPVDSAELLAFAIFLRSSSVTLPLINDEGLCRLVARYAVAREEE